MVDFHANGRPEFAAVGHLNPKLFHPVRIRRGIGIVCALAHPMRIALDNPNALSNRTALLIASSH